ncbi:MAG: tRNA preQ1(34) S-adenosylmethionine ribosyltransferase-isomerase QueA [Rickettsiales bacterium]
MKTSDFDFTLPQELIASAPVCPRDAARMLVVAENTYDKKITDLTSYLKKGDVLVFNDSKVIPARLIGKRGDAKIEVLLHKRIFYPMNPHPIPLPEGEGTNMWKCFAKPAKKLRVGDVVNFADDFSASVIEKYDDGQVLLGFSYSGDIFEQKLNTYGAMPLPPYIERVRCADDADNNSYQTIYAKNSGSVAAPTAGLHFTDRLLDAIDKMGVERLHVTLHVGGGTFLPVKAEDTNDHVMHSEYAVVTGDVAEIINVAKKAGGRVIAVGTTSVRTLESATNKHGILQEFAGETDIFITPGYEFKLVDAMLTNFHLPKSTLFMLVSAFSGLDRMKAAYAHAIEQKYRFYSYGDACLLFSENK